MARLAAVGNMTHCRGERSLMETERPIPQPITPESKPYWDGMKEDKLMLPKCQDCGKVHFYPRVFCPHCHSKNLTWIQGSGKGKLYSFEILYRPFKIGRASCRERV